MKYVVLFQLTLLLVELLLDDVVTLIIVELGLFVAFYDSSWEDDLGCEVCCLLT